MVANFVEGEYVNSAIDAAGAAIVAIIATFISVPFTGVPFADAAVSASSAFTAFVVPSTFIGMGLGAWDRAEFQTDWMRFLAIFAFPYFCGFPIVVIFSTLFMLRYLAWQYTALIWVIVLGTCTALWLYGQNKERKASNPLKGILDVAK